MHDAGAVKDLIRVLIREQLYRRSGYFGFGGNGGNFKLVNPHGHPANPLNLNPFHANAPKMGFVMDHTPNGFQPPGPAVGLDQFGGIRAR